MYGHVSMCDYLFNKQLPLPAHNELACNTAAERGHTEALRWLHEHSCPWIATDVLATAARAGSVAMLSYLQAEGLLDSVSTLTQLLQRAGANSRLAAAQWLRLAWARAEGCTSPLLT
jgi:hypothetical protein